MQKFGKMTIKILNLYAGIGGNRKLWTGDIEVTAIENVPEIAKIYQDFFPQDKVIVCDAHQFLLEHFKEFDFIWSSPPCPSHSHIRKELAVFSGQNRPIFPDMKLYEEIIFLQHYFKGKFVVENVRSFYKPLIEPQEVGKHFYWANFVIAKVKKQSRNHNDGLELLKKRKGFDLSKYQCDKRLLLRNCVEPELGLHIFNMAFKSKQNTLNLGGRNSSQA
jgi:DNA (cytosine-5)-methyltransferase 1